MAVTYKPFSKFEPAVSFRYVLTSTKLGSGEGYLCKAAGLPKIDQGEIVIDYINTDFKVKGKSRWTDITITMYNPVSDANGANAVHTWIKGHHDSGEGTDTHAFGGYKEDMKIAVLQPNGEKAQEWTLYGAFISAADWGDMDWAGEDANTIELTIKYDYATLQQISNAPVTANTVAG